MSSNSIAIHLPDGAVREVPVGTTPLEIANSISPRLAAASVVARLTPWLTAEQLAIRSQCRSTPAKPPCMRPKTPRRPGWSISPRR